MTITKNMLLYFIRDMGITILGETKTEQQFAGIKHWIPEREDLSDEYLYLCDGAHIPEKTQILSQTACMLVIFSQKEAGQKNQEQRKKWRQFHNNLICIETEKSVPEVMNALVEIFYRLVEWDKNMHIAALEGKDVQELIDISEPVLEYPMIVFDASFDVLAYTNTHRSLQDLLGNRAAGIYGCTYHGAAEEKADFFPDTGRRNVDRAVSGKRWHEYLSAVFQRTDAAWLYLFFLWGSFTGRWISGSGPHVYEKYVFLFAAQL